MTAMSGRQDPVYLAVCAACSAYPSASFWATEVPQQPPFYCPRCQPGLLSGEEQLARPNPVVNFRGTALEARWCVLEILDDGWFLARPLGLPDWPAVKRHVSDIRPLFSYAQLDRARQSQPRHPRLTKGR